MKNLNNQLKQLCRQNRDGNYSTQSKRWNLLMHSAISIIEGPRWPKSESFIVGGTSPKNDLEAMGLACIHHGNGFACALGHGIHPAFRKARQACYLVSVRKRRTLAWHKDVPTFSVTISH